MVFGIATIMLEKVASPSIVIDRQHWPIAAAARAAGIKVPSGGLLEYLQNWNEVLPVLKRLTGAIRSGAAAAERPLAWDEVRLAPPVCLPRKVFCVGANYSDHLDEMGVPRQMHPDPNANPFFFLKPGSTAVVGAGPTVHIPAKCQVFDWEAEAVVVFGKGGRNISLDRALDHVAGYTLGIDFTSRNQMAIPDHPLKWDLVLGKCQDAMTPIGPVFVPREFVDGDEFEFTLSVNGVVKQNANTKNMIHSIARQIASISEGITVEPGDLLLTGSPAGVGAPRGERLAPGDVVVVESSVTGPMQVTIQAPITVGPA